MIRVSDKAVSRWETGRGFPDIGNLEMIADCLDVSAAELIRGERIREQITKEELVSITSDGLSLTGILMSKKKTVSLLTGFLLGLLLVSIAVIHLASPVYDKDPDAALQIEELSDGRIVAVLGEDVSGHDIERVRDPETGSDLVFVSCYSTKWDRLRGKTGGELVLIGGKEDVDAVYYYPTGGEDRLLYGKAPGGAGGVVTLPRLIYNYWLILGIVFTIIGFAAYALCRKRYYAGRVLSLALLPLAFTVSIPLCLWGRFSEVYDAAYHLSGILLLTAVLYPVMRIFISGIAKKTDDDKIREHAIAETESAE